MAETTAVTLQVPNAQLTLAEEAFCSLFGLPVSAQNAKNALAKNASNIVREFKEEQLEATNRAKTAKEKSEATYPVIE